MNKIKIVESEIDLQPIDNQILEKNIPLDYFSFGVTVTGHFLTIKADNQSVFLFRYDDLKPKLIANSLEELFGVQNINEL